VNVLISKPVSTDNAGIHVTVVKMLFAQSNHIVLFVHVKKALKEIPILCVEQSDAEAIPNVNQTRLVSTKIV
jgi:hypothetical protein